MKKISFDAGHGLNTPGKRSTNGIREWSFNNLVAIGFEREILKYNVNLLRVDDRTGQKDISLPQRAKLSNNFKADIHISIHHNALAGKWGSHTGTEIYHFPKSNKGKELAKYVLPDIIKVYGLRNRGVKSANFAILRETKAPAILIEGGFMDSTIDMEKLSNDSLLIKVGEQLARTIATYLKLTNNTNTTPSKPSNNTSNFNSIVDYLKTKNIDSSFSNRKKLANQYGIKNYTGTSEQNLRLLSLIQNNTNKKKTYLEMAHEIIKGKHGNGHENRRKSLGISKLEYEEVRKIVNQVMS